MEVLVLVAPVIRGIKHFALASYKQHTENPGTSVTNALAFQLNQAKILTGGSVESFVIYCVAVQSVYRGNVRLTGEFLVRVEWSQRPSSLICCLAVIMRECCSVRGDRVHSCSRPTIDSHKIIFLALCCPPSLVEL